MRGGSDMGKEGKPIRRCLIELFTAAGGWLLKSAEISEKPHETYFKTIHLGRGLGKREREKHLSISSVPHCSEICLTVCSLPRTSGLHTCCPLCLFLRSPELWVI